MGEYIRKTETRVNCRKQRSQKSVSPSSHAQASSRNFAQRGVHSQVIFHGNAYQLKSAIYYGPVRAGPHGRLKSGNSQESVRQATYHQCRQL